jgi:hypothetical protein
MAKRNSKVAPEGSTPATRAPSTNRTEAMEQRVLAFAKQAGYVAGTIQNRAEGWMDRETLGKQLASVRDSATHLLEQLGNVARRSGRKPAARSRKVTRARSGGVVDAPGKKHRKRAPADPDARLAQSQARKLRAATPMEKTTMARHRNRG